MDVHAAIDRAWTRFTEALPAELKTIASDLPHRFALTPHAGTPWSRVFNNPAVLGFPALLLERADVAGEVRDRAISGHLLAIVGAFGTDRVDDGQILLDERGAALLRRLRSARDETVRPLLERAPDCELTFAWGEQMTALSLETERAVASGRTAPTHALYRAVSWQKQGLAFPASMMAVAAAGWSAERRERVRELIAGAALGLQYRDDVVDWEDDIAAGASWPVLLLERRPAEVSLAGLRESLAGAGALTSLLSMSSGAFHDAAVAADALGADRLAEWAEGQSSTTAELAAAERDAPGYAVQWERDRRARREAQQAGAVRREAQQAAGASRARDS